MHGLPSPTGKNAFKLGVCGYTNVQSGIGLFTAELFHYLGDKNTSILSINAGVKGQEIWTDRQLTAGRPPSVGELEEYFTRFEPDVILFVETPFSMSLYDVARRHNCRVCGIPMHETYHAGRLKPDLLICTCYSAWEKAQRRDKKLLFLPIGLELFPFKLRQNHTFVCNVGYGGPHDRRQVSRLVAAFTRICNPNARLLLNCQQKDYPPGVRIDDSRITYNLGSYPLPSDAYREGDIAIFPMAYGGYERPILEAMASGMPCVTTDADPMNLYQHDPDLLLSVARTYQVNSEWVVNTTYNEISVEELTVKMEWLLDINTATYSQRARKQAEAQSWECKHIVYKDIWLEALSTA